ncbi:MAG TPA: hypothetical protein VHZ95_10210 [Polyangiales bacterium]|nr:hypothetical protein [Polyangiales bacterium]
MSSKALLFTVGILSVSVVACGDDDSTTTGGSGGSSGSSGKSGNGGTGGTKAAGSGGSSGKGGTGGSGSGTLCDKYGGKDNVGMVITGDVIPMIAADCRISPFFTSLSMARLTHLSDCLSTQAEELFACEGVTYAGSKDSAGVTCRDMKTTHTGLGIGSADFDALIEDVAAGLKKAGVSDADITTAGGALSGLKSMIVEMPDATSPTMPTAMCEADAGI